MHPSSAKRNRPNIHNTGILHGTFTFRKLASYFFKCLHKDKHSVELFTHRSQQYVDVVVLLDWNTTQETLTSNNRLSTLKVIFDEWDPGVKYKKIKILNGGYQEWLARYPAFTTNPNVIVPEIDSVANEILDTIEYPEWLNSDEEEEFVKKARSKLNNAKTSNKNTDVEMAPVGDNKLASKHARTNTNDTVSSAKPKNFTSHVTIPIDGKRSVRGDNTANAQRFNSSDALHKTTTSNKIPQNEVSAKPVIDRSNKPVSLKPTYDPRCKEVLKFMKMLSELAKSKVKLANELFDHEYQLYAQHDDKHRDANDEKYLHGEIKSLKVKLEDMVNSVAPTIGFSGSASPLQSERDNFVCVCCSTRCTLRSRTSLTSLTPRSRTRSSSIPPTTMRRRILN